MIEAWRIGVKISVINGFSNGLALFSREAMSAQKKVVGLQAALDATTRSMKIGGMMAGAGFLGLSMFDKAIDKAKDYQSQLSLLKVSGADQIEVAQGVALAWKTSHEVMSTSAADNLRAIRELRSVLGPNSIGEIGSVLPQIQRMSGTLTALTGKPPEGLANDVVRFTELRGSGVVTPQALAHNTELMARTVLAMGGTVTPADMHATLKQSKLAGMHLNDEFLFQELPFLIQEWKTGKGGTGQAAGTAQMSAFQTFIGGVVKKSAIPLWLQGGLISANGVVSNKTGGYQLKPGALKDAALYEANPYEWVLKDLAPAVARIQKLRHLTTEQVLAGLAGNRNTQIDMASLLEKSPQIERDRKLFAGAPNSLAAYNQLLKTSPELAGIALSKQWENVQTQLVFDTLPKLIELTSKLASGLDWLTGVMRQHPVAIRRITEAFVGLSGALMIGGTLKMVTAGFQGLGLVISAGGGLNKLLSGVAGGLGLLSQGIAVVSAAMAGWWAGKQIYNHAIAGTKAGDVIGNIETRMMAALGSKNAQDVLNNMYGPKNHSGDFHPERMSWANKPVQVSTTINLDGKAVAKVVTKHQATAAAAPQTGMSGLDTSQFASPIGITGSW